MSSILLEPIFPNLTKVSTSGDQLRELWKLFTKVKDCTQGGRRLENLYWRLWYKSSTNGGVTEGDKVASLLETWKEGDKLKVEKFQAASTVAKHGTGAAKVTVDSSTLTVVSEPVAFSSAEVAEKPASTSVAASQPMALPTPPPSICRVTSNLKALAGANIVASSSTSSNVVSSSKMAAAPKQRPNPLPSGAPLPHPGYKGIMTQAQQQPKAGPLDQNFENQFLTQHSKPRAETSVRPPLSHRAVDATPKSNQKKKFFITDSCESDESDDTGSDGEFDLVKQRQQQPFNLWTTATTANATAAATANAKPVNSACPTVNATSDYPGNFPTRLNQPGSGFASANNQFGKIQVEPETCKKQTSNLSNLLHAPPPKVAHGFHQSGFRSGQQQRFNLGANHFFKPADANDFMMSAQPFTSNQNLPFCESESLRKGLQMDRRPFIDACMLGYDDSTNGSTSFSSTPSAW